VTGDERGRNGAPAVLLAGLPSDLAASLADRFPQARFERVEGAEAAVAALTGPGRADRGAWALVVLDGLGEDGTPAVAAARAALPDRPPLLACVDAYTIRQPPAWLRAARQQVRLLVRPVEPAELAGHVARLLDLPVPAAADGRGGDGEPGERMAAMLAGYRQRVAGQLATLEQAVAALNQATLDAGLRAAAEREAHRLTGAAGTFGFARASAVARKLEALLGRPGLGTGDDAASASGLLADLRREFTAALDERPDGLDERPVATGLGPAGERALLIVAPDRATAAELAALAAERGLAAAVATAPAEAAAAAAGRAPDAVLAVDLDQQATAELLRELGGRLPALVRTPAGSAADRAELARLGGRGFLPADAGPAQVLEAAVDLLARLDQVASTVLAVDDDPTVLGLVRAVLEPAGLRVVGVGDPLAFWDALQTTNPDLLVLDIDLPNVDGIQLCRAVRAEPRWAQLPILFVTGRTDPDAVQRVYAAGADDFVAKPIVGPELVTRARNRLERVQLFRRLAETDGLTGSANRRSAEQTLERLERLSARYRQPLAVALLDLDGFKQVNDTHGHGAGDLVLRRLAGLLRRSFRGEDVVARWGGEEFLVGMYGMTRDDGVHRIAECLEALRATPFHPPGGPEFHVSFSAGVAEFPHDGTDLAALYRAADQALYRAKAAGRDRVLPAGPPPDPDGLDVGLLGPGGPVIDALVHGLGTRGYRVGRLDAAAPAGGPVPRVLVVNLTGPDGPSAAATLPSPGPELLAGARLLVADGGELVALVADAAAEDAARAAGAEHAVVVPTEPAVLVQQVRRALRAGWFAQVTPAPARR
jgi:diguanylate cyclase (GGDEF)-like protein